MCQLMTWAERSSFSGAQVSTFQLLQMRVFPTMLQVFLEKITLEEHKFCTDQLRSISVV